MTNEEQRIIREQTAKIVESGALGRSRSYARLLEFLVECSLEGRTPKEHEIATTVFNRGADFDPGQDSMVRVYAHHLRQKLDNYYASAGRDEQARIAIPKGEYRVVAVPASPSETAAVEDEQAPRPRQRYFARAAFAAAFLVAGLVIGWSLRPAVPDDAGPAAAAADSPIWSAMLEDDTPVLIVVGDYYIFGELDEAGNVDRLIRNFSINSAKDLDEYIMFEPDVAARYIDLDLTYLPRSAAFALRDLLRVLYSADKRVGMTSMSDLDAADLRSNHILYVGYVSALDKLSGFVFSRSGLEVGETYDELLEKKSGTAYMSEAGMPASYRNYRDYGLFSTFPGPGGNRFAIVAGTRDVGLMQTAYAISDPSGLAELEGLAPAEGDGAPSLEVLYEVSGLDRTSLDARIVYSAALDEEG